MSYDDAIKALSKDALKLVRNNQTVGLGSGRAATSFVKSLSLFVKKKKINVRCIPTSLQIKLEAEKGKLHLIDTVPDKIDIVFDGADQIDKEKNLIKGGGGALLRENILINAAKKVVIMADDSKFVTNFKRDVPVEVHPLARNTVAKAILKIGGKSSIRTLDRGYPFITENGNIILDCNFGVIKKPKILQERIKKQQLVEACFSQGAARTAKELVVAVARIDTWKRNRDFVIEGHKKRGPLAPLVKKYYYKLVPLAYIHDYFGFAGCVKKILSYCLGLLGLFRPVPRGPIFKSDLFEVVTKTTALACQNFMLALVAQGFDSCPMEGFDEKRVKKILKLGWKTHVVMVLGVGKANPAGIYGERFRIDNSLVIKEI